MMKKGMVFGLLLGMVCTAAGVMQTYANEWKRDDLGWWFVPTQGSYFRSSWNNISEKWYYFDDRGYMAENRWIGDYYVGADGAMLTNTTTPDGVRVGADGRREESFNSGEISEFQRRVMEAAIGAYIDVGKGEDISSDGTFLRMMGRMIQFGSYDIFPSYNARVKYYRLYEMDIHYAYKIDDIVRLTESITGRSIPFNAKNILWESGFAISDEFFGPIQASGEAYHEITITNTRLENGKLVASGRYMYGVDPDYAKRGTVEAVFRCNSNSMFGMSMETVMVRR